MYDNLTKSIVITGASATGKTTLCRRLMVHFGLQSLPVHMTRDLRSGEIADVDGVFITEDEFKARFADGCYLQTSLESAYFSGYYSGCPKEWLNKDVTSGPLCFVCPTVKMARELKEELGQGIFWIHLVANQEIRQKRLMQRSPEMKTEDFASRIDRGSVSVDITGHDLIIDTSNLNAWEIFFHALTRL